MKRRVCLLSMMSVLMSLSSCGTIGEKDFACPGRPPGVRCMSASEVYRATHHTDRVDPTASEALGDEPRNSDSTRRLQSTPAASSSGRPQPLAHDEAASRRPIPQVDRPVPIRTPAQVMRAWIAPWEDVRGVLHGGEHAFIEIVARRWSLGEREAAEPVRFFSIQAPPNDAKPDADATRNKPTTAGGSSVQPERSPSKPSPLKPSSKTGVSK